MVATFRTMYADIMAESAKALELQEKRLAVNPSDTDAWYERGAVLVKLGHYREALASFEMAMEINSKYGGAWVAQADVHKKLGEIRLAAESYPKMISAPGVITMLPKTAVWTKERNVTQDELAAFEHELLEFDEPVPEAIVAPEISNNPSAAAIDVETMDVVALYTFLSESSTVLKPLLALALKEGIDITQGMQHISEVVVYGKRKEAKKAVNTMILGMKSIKGAIYVKLLKDISNRENDIAELETAWASVMNARELLNSSKALLVAGEYLDIPKNLSEVGTRLEPFQKTLPV